MKKRFRSPIKIDLPHDVSDESILSLFDRESKDLELFNSVDAELIKLSGSLVMYYKVYINENYDKTYLEERNKIVAKDPIKVWASYDPKPIEEEMSEFGLELNNDQVFVFNKSYIDRALGRPPQAGDIIEATLQNIKYELYEVQEDSFQVYGVYHYNCFGKVLRDSSDVVDDPTLDTFDEEPTTISVVDVKRDLPERDVYDDLGYSSDYNASNPPVAESNPLVPSGPIDVIIAIGQSNIDGVSIPIQSYGIDPSYLLPIPEIQVWMPDSLEASTGNWRSMDTVNFGPPGEGGLNTTRYSLADVAGRFTPFYTRHYDFLLPFCKTLYDNKNFPKHATHLIKNTKSGTFMVSGLEATSFLSWTDSSSPVYNYQGSGLYTTLINDAYEAIGAIRTKYPNDPVAIKAILMIQGESESLPIIGLPSYPTQDGAALAWGAAFSGTLYPNLQQDLKAVQEAHGIDVPESDIPVIIGRIHQELYGLNYPNARIVRDQQETVAADPAYNVHTVDLDGLTFRPGDNGELHFDAPSLNTIAQRFYTKYLAVADVSVEGPGP